MIAAWPSQLWSSNFSACSDNQVKFSAPLALKFNVKDMLSFPKALKVKKKQIWQKRAGVKW